MRWRLAIVVLLCTLAWSAAGEVRPAWSSPEEIAVIAHPDVPADELSQSELRALFTLTRTYWPDGSRAVPFNYPPHSATRVEFDRGVLGMDPDQVARFWLERRIRGQAASIRSAGNPALLVKVVTRLPGSVTYVPASAVAEGVKVVARVRNGKVVGQ